MAPRAVTIGMPQLRLVQDGHGKKNKTRILPSIRFITDKLTLLSELEIRYSVPVVWINSSADWADNIMCQW